MPIPNLSNSSASGSGTGDQTSAGNVFTGGSVNFGAGSSNGLSPIVLIAIAGLVLWMFNKKR